MTGAIRLGTCSWADRTMVEAWYPKEVKTPADRLAYYARLFDTVEVDSSFYGLPSERNSTLWAERTPAGFVFHVKAFAMMTRHEVRPKQLPASLVAAYDLETDRRGRVVHPPRELRETVFEWFSSALAPLRQAGKLGVVLLQFPPYFVANERNRAYISWAVEKLAPDRVAVEFRHNSWVLTEELDRTLDLLAGVEASYVGVDEPRLETATVLPPITAATSSTGYVRFSGRNKETWHARLGSAALRFRYLYDEEELREWVEPVLRLAADTEQTFVMFNNCYRDYAPRNAQQMARLLGVGSGEDDGESGGEAGGSEDRGEDGGTAG
jgi:uncharacterized protein YecE (DUF72 family)